MASRANYLATNVCIVCKNRKKGCDKKLPTCGYCDKRGLECHYEVSADDRCLDVRQWNVDFQGMRGRGKSAKVSPPSIPTFTEASSPIIWWLSQSLRPNRTLSPRKDLGRQIQDFLGALNRSTSKIREDFFQGIHRWLPIIAPWRLSDAELNFKNQDLEPDTLMLLLAMSLSTYNQPAHTDTKFYPSNGTEYLTVKLLFAQAQATLTATMALIQAGILIAIYELGGRLPQIAYVTLRTCRGMCDILGIGRSQANDSFETLHMDSTLRAIEECNLARGLTIMERLTLLEASDRVGQDLTTSFVALSPLPQYFSQQLAFDSQIFTTAYFDSAIQSHLQSYLGDGFVRQAQAVAILDQVLHHLRSLASVDHKLQSLRGLDDQLQGFLAMAMENYRLPGHHCGAIAVAIRTLFLLHFNIQALNKGSSDFNKATGGYEATSSAALDSAARMMADVAKSHMKDIANIDILPLTASYNARISIQHFQSRKQANESLSNSDLQALIVMDKAFRRRWIKDKVLDCSPIP